MKTMIRSACTIAFATTAWLGFAAPSAAQQTCINDTSGTGNGVRVFPREACDGLEYTVSIPNQCARRGGCGLIFDVHGFVMDASIQNRNTEMRRLGRENGFVVVQPTARVDPAMGVPSFAGDPEEAFSNNPDADRIAEFARQAIEAFDIDPNRVHIGGFSQGGFIAYDFVCRYPDMIASASPIAASSVDCFEGGLPVPVLATHSTGDELVLFEDADATRAAILRGMGLELSDGIVLIADEGITQTRFLNERGEILEFIQHDFIGASAAAGHCFPGSFEEAEDRVSGGPGVGNLRFACEDDAAIRVSEAQIQFYIQNPKR